MKKSNNFIFKTIKKFLTDIKFVIYWFTHNLYHLLDYQKFLKKLKKRLLRYDILINQF